MFHAVSILCFLPMINVIEFLKLYPMKNIVFSSPAKGHESLRHGFFKRLFLKNYLADFNQSW